MQGVGGRSYACMSQRCLKCGEPIVDLQSADLSGYGICPVSSWRPSICATSICPGARLANIEIPASDLRETRLDDAELMGSIRLSESYLRGASLNSMRC